MDIEKMGLMDNSFHLFIKTQCIEIWKKNLSKCTLPYNNNQDTYEVPTMVDAPINALMRYLTFFFFFYFTKYIVEVHKNLNKINLICKISKLI